MRQFENTIQQQEWEFPYDDDDNDDDVDDDDGADDDGDDDEGYDNESDDDDDGDDDDDSDEGRGQTNKHIGWGLSCTHRACVCIT